MWYYAQGNQQVGPVDEATLQQAITAGHIGPDTLVWREGMADWQPWRQVQVEMAGQHQSAPTPQAAPMAQTGGGIAQCVECGNHFDTGDMVSYQGQYICAACKPHFFQRLQEGGQAAGQFIYAGFWIRFVAKFVDGIITSIIGALVGIVFGLSLGTDPSPEAAMAVSMMLNIVSIAIGVGYITFFLGRFGATPGKMALGLKVVRPDGSPLTYGRACGRAFAEFLSGLILMIGYIMAAFDDEKRALHDRIADTRVIKA